MHKAQSYVEAHIRPSVASGKLATASLNASQAAGLKLSLAGDAADYLYSGIVSIADAVQAIDRSMYTWATVKLYYSVFYIARSMLAASGFAIIYDGSKPFSLKCAAGAMPIKRDGPTHKVVLSSFKALLPGSPILSQQIGATEAMDWLMLRREEANYTQPRFCEPNPPGHFKTVSEVGTRRALSAYVKDKSFLYCFDPEHAMLALPVESLKALLSLISSSGMDQILSQEDRKFLAGIYFDKSGPLAEMTGILKA